MGNIYGLESKISSWGNDEEEEPICWSCGYPYESHSLSEARPDLCENCVLSCRKCGDWVDEDDAYYGEDRCRNCIDKDEETRKEELQDTPLCECGECGICRAKQHSKELKDSWGEGDFKLSSERGTCYGCKVNLRQSSGSIYSFKNDSNPTVAFCEDCFQGPAWEKRNASLYHLNNPEYRDIYGHNQE